MDRYKVPVLRNGGNINVIYVIEQLYVGTDREQLYGPSASHKYTGTVAAHQDTVRSLT